MLRVVVVVDKKDSAIDRLARGSAKYHDNLDLIICDVHPKRPDMAQLSRFKDAAFEADLIDWQYFRTAEMLRERYPWLSEKPQMLTHHNPYSITESDWNGYDMVVANNRTIYKRLGDITQAPVEYVPNAVDTDFWTFNQQWQPNGTVIMVANRIESKKGVLPVALACGSLGLKLILVGSISDRRYFEDIMNTGCVSFHEQISDAELRDLYYGSTIHVCNSVDNFESGTMPMLEAMLCGVPVLTRNIGQVPELSNGSNMVVSDHHPEDVQAIAGQLRSMLMDKKALAEMREAGWQSAKTRSHVRRAYQYQKLYRQLLYPQQAPVSIVVPIYDKPDVMRRCFDAIAAQTYKNFELIVVDDNVDTLANFEEGKLSNRDVVKDFGRYANFPVRYIPTFSIEDDYGLARARNVATIEATGDIMVYCDQRMIMAPDAVQRFVENIKPKHWLYGNKGASKKEFVENFSAVYRQDIMNAGMFNERCTQYGALSQEIRTRIRAQGMVTEYVAPAKATPTGKSSNRMRRRGEIIKSKNMLWKMWGDQ